MKKTSLFFIILGLTAISCATLNLEDLLIDPGIQSKLPPLQQGIIIGQPETVFGPDFSITGSYTYQDARTKISVTGVQHPKLIEIRQEMLAEVKSQYNDSKLYMPFFVPSLRDKRQLDEMVKAKMVKYPFRSPFGDTVKFTIGYGREWAVSSSMYQKFFEQQNKFLVESGTDHKGYMTYEVISKERLVYWPLLISVGTVFSINLFGFPALKSRTKIWMTVGIYDENGMLIRRYFADEKGTAYEALYWGYGPPPDVSSVASYKAFRNAHYSIIKQIEPDIPFLNSRLRHN